MALSVKVINSTSVTLTHKGGDPLIWSAIEIRTYLPVGTFKDSLHTVDLEQGIYTPTNEAILVDTGMGYYEWAPPLKTGEEAVFDWAACFVPAYLPGTWSAPVAGEPVDILIFDKASGKMIISTRAITV
jgi:hypothetical protein